MTRSHLTQQPERPDASVRSRVRRLVLVIAGMVQLFGVLAGPLEHWRSSAPLVAHVETSGTSQHHYQHDEATCAGCVMSDMAASPVRRLATVSLQFRAPMAVRHTAHLPSLRPRRTQAAPRAPPARTPVG